MLCDAWPLFGLVLSTPRLQLRIPLDEEVAALSEVAAQGVHGPHERPFLTPWTEPGPEARARSVMQGHWSRLGSWDAHAWALGLAIFLDGRPIGALTLRAQDFPVVREVRTTSWLGLTHQGQGFGTEARAGALGFAFDHLAAEAALSEVFQDNHASQAVSRKLGYQHDGTSRDARGEEVLISDRLRLTRDAWASGDRLVVEVRGFEGCRAMFGLDD